MKFIRFKDANGDEVLVNVDHVILCTWVQVKQKGPDGKMIDLIGQKTVAIVTTELAKGTSWARFVHERSAQVVFDWFSKHAEHINSDEVGNDGEESSNNDIKIVKPE